MCAKPTREVRTIVLGPKREVSSSDDVLRQEADDGPGDVIRGARRRDEPNTGEHKSVKVSARCPGAQLPLQSSREASSKPCL